MTSEFDRMFDESAWPSFRWPSFRARPETEAAAWYPEVDVFERDSRLVTKVDLPGMKKEDVKVEVTDGYLTISGERRSEAEEKKDVKATFSNGVLEVSLPLPAQPEPKVRKVEIQEAPRATRTEPEDPCPHGTTSPTTRTSASSASGRRGPRRSGRRPWR
ncbi:MAG: Hsp20/alpha crystallin family protein [Vicinamibacterales bacterium]